MRQWHDLVDFAQGVSVDVGVLAVILEDQVCGGCERRVGHGDFREHVGQRDRSRLAYELDQLVLFETNTWEIAHL